MQRDLHHTRPKTSRLNLLCPAPLLDALPGVAGLVDLEANWSALSQYWDRLMSRANRPELSRDVLLGKPFHDLLADRKQQGQLQKVFTSLAEGRLEQHSQTLEFGTGGRALHVEMILKPLTMNGAFVGMLVQMLDVTGSHLNRLALLDRERKLRGLQEKTESQTTEHTEAMARRTLEHAREVAALHEELERVSTGQTAQVAQLKESFAAATRRREEQHMQKLQELAAIVAEANAIFHARPAESGRELCRIIKQQSGCAFVTLYRYLPDERQFELCDTFDAPEVFDTAAEHGMLRLAEGEGTCGLAAEERAPVKFSRLLDSPEYALWANWAREYGYNCLWAIPLCANDTALGVAQLYYAQEDVPMPPEQLQLLNGIAQAAAPIVCAAPAVIQAPPVPDHALPPPASGDAGCWRVIIAELARQYGSLMTGVLGHSTLAAAELGETHAAREDIRAIERAARTGVRLTRRLAALAGDRTQAPLIEIGAYLQAYISQHRVAKNGSDSTALPVAPCEVRAEAAALEVILDGIVDYARRDLIPDAAPLWTLVEENGSATLTLLYDAPPDSTGTSAEPPLEFLLSCEAAKALGGRLEIAAMNGQKALALTLPVENIPAN